MSLNNPKVRTAKVIVPDVSKVEDRLREVSAYLPANYTARLAEGNSLPVVVLIEGIDDHGWTLDDYVIPRLASGLITAREV